MKISPADDSEPYLQHEKYNAAWADNRESTFRLPLDIADSPGVRKMMSHHLMYLPLSQLARVTS